MSKLSEALEKDARNRTYESFDKEQVNNLHDFFEAWLAKRFGGMDFWQLPKHYKKSHYAQCATELVLTLDIEIQNALKSSKDEQHDPT